MFLNFQSFNYSFSLLIIFCELFTFHFYLRRDQVSSMKMETPLGHVWLLLILSKHLKSREGEFSFEFSVLTTKKQEKLIFSSCKLFTPSKENHSSMWRQDLLSWDHPLLAATYILFMPITPFDLQFHHSSCLSLSSSQHSLFLSLIFVNICRKQRKYNLTFLTARGYWLLEVF